MSEGLCGHCCCVWVLADGKLPTHNIGLHPHTTECWGSGKEPTKLVIDDKLVDAKKAKEIQ